MYQCSRKFLVVISKIINRLADAKWQVLRNVSYIKICSALVIVCHGGIRVRLHWSESESDIASRWVLWESNLMFTFSSDKDERKQFALGFAQCKWPLRASMCEFWFLCKQYIVSNGKRTIHINVLADVYFILLLGNKFYYLIFFVESINLWQRHLAPTLRKGPDLSVVNGFPCFTIYKFSMSANCAISVAQTER